MTVHPKDLSAANPRMQCACCGGWERLHGRTPDGKAFQRFYGGCNHNHGGDHLAATKTNGDVCEECCKVECHRLASEKIRSASTVDWPDPVPGGGKVAACG